MSFTGNLQMPNMHMSGRAASTRGRMVGGSNGVGYPSPFFDLAHTYLPTQMKQLFRFCRYYFLTNPLINATIFKLSEYPVTDIIVDHADEKVRNRWTEFLQDGLRIRPFQIETGLDYNCFGNSMNSIGFPFKKYLTCRFCKYQQSADKMRERWTYTGQEFRLNCPSCSYTGDAYVQDRYFRNASGIKLIRWNCENIDVQYNEITAQTTYIYNIPQTLKNDITIGKKEQLENTPQVFLQALREQKGVVFSPDNFYHLKRASIAAQDRGWGIPLILPVLKDVFYLQLMKKAQEAILLEHIVPMRILFPQAGSGSSDPYSTIDLARWKDHVAGEIARWRLDNNYIPIMPLPLGNQTIGGDGRALLLTQEIQTWSDQILVGLGVPREFIYGGMSYAGTNVSMRMLENAFIGYISSQKEMVRWIVRQIAAFMGWPVPKIRFKPFKMADDIQRKAYLFQLNQAQKISDTTLLADSDLSIEEENAIMLAETARRHEAMKRQQLAMADIQSEAQVTMAKGQAKAQQVMMEAQAAPVAPGEPGSPEMGMPGMVSDQQLGSAQLPGGLESGIGQQSDMGIAPHQGAPSMGVDITQMAQMLAEQISQLPPDQQTLALQNVQAQNPELASLVQQLVQARQAQQNQSSAQAGFMGSAVGQSVQGVDMRPQPEQKGPRRAAASV